MKLLTRISRAFAPLVKETTAAQAHHAHAPNHGVLGLPDLLPGYTRAAAGTYATYRLMRSHPTIAMARLIATAPIRNTPIDFSATHGSDEQLAFIRKCIEPLWPQLLQQACFALDYGWKPFEKVFAMTHDRRIALAKLKPLNVDRTRMLVDEKTGAFAGLKQGDVTLPAEKSFVVTHDMEDDDRYGRSRHENVRDAWNAWTDLLQKEGKYVGKIAGVIPIIKYPQGSGRDRHGAEKSNFELAQAVLANLGRGHGVAMPNSLATWAEDLTRAGLDVSQLAAWQIQFLEAGTSHAQGFIEQMRHKESLMMRGWLVPERTALESQMGTRADASAHGDVALTIAQATLADIVRTVNRHVIDQLLALNWGESARGGVVLSARPIDDARQTLLRQIAHDVLTQPGNVELLRRSVNLEALLAGAGVPMRG